MTRHTIPLLLLATLLSTLVLSICQAETLAEQEGERNAMLVHYIEIVTPEVAEHCKTLAAVQGLKFGPAVADLGGARTAEAADGTLVGVRTPLAAHEEPVVRVYTAVENIGAAVAAAEAAGAVVAYPPTVQGDTGTWAIYIRDGIQYGLWQR